MEPVTQLDENFPWIAEVESAKGQAVVQHHAAVSHIQSGYRHREIFPEVLAEREIKRRVRGQVVQGRTTGATPAAVGPLPLLKPEP